MSLKQKIEDNLTLTVLGLLLTGFIAGVGVYKTLLTVAPTTAFPGGSVVIDTSALQKQVDELLSAHTARVQELQKRLLEYESEATNLGHIDSNQKIYADSAKRISEQISEENNSFFRQLQALRGLSSDTSLSLGGSQHISPSASP
jgi:hypothetical protein